MSQNDKIQLTGEEDTAHMRFLQYDLFRDNLIKMMKDFLFQNAIENVKPDLHEFIKEVADHASKGKTVDVEMKTSVGEKGGIVFEFDYDVL